MKKVYAKGFSIVTVAMLAFTLVFNALPATVTAQAATVSTWEELQNALASATDGAVITFNPTGGGTMGIQVPIGEHTIDGGNRNITIIRGENANESIFWVNNNAQLTLQNIIIDGGNTQGREVYSIVCVSAGGELILENGAVLQNNNSI
jgi:hypothetical protein